MCHKNSHHMKLQKFIYNSQYELTLYILNLHFVMKLKLHEKILIFI